MRTLLAGLVAAVFAVSLCAPQNDAKPLDADSAVRAARAKPMDADAAVQAARAKPLDANTVLRAAAAKQSTRQFPESIALFEQYIQLQPTGPHVSLAKAAIAGMRRQLEVLPDDWYRSLNPHDLYLLDTIRAGVWRWPRQAMPLRVSVLNADAHLAKLTASALQAWEKAGSGVVSFTVAAQGEPNITISFVEDRKDPALRASQAATDRSREGQPQRVDMKVLVVRHLSNAPLSDDDLAKTITHEFGHAIGLGHSGVPRDMMMPGGSVSGISANDVAMLSELYSLPESVLITNALAAVDRTHAPHRLAYASLLRQRATAFLHEGRTKDARADLAEVYALLVKEKNGNLLEVTYRLADLAWRSRDWPAAQLWYQRLVDDAHRTGNVNMEARCEANYAVASAQLHQRPQTLAAIARAKELIAAPGVSADTLSIVTSAIRTLEQPSSHGP